MCKLCTEHGDGKIWYKNAKNYASDLISDLRRRQYIRDFLETTIGEGVASLGRLETIFRKKKRLPAHLVQGMEGKAREEHFGQIVPIEDIREIIGKAETVVRMPCACRWAAERREKRCCYSVSYSAATWYDGLDMGYFGQPQAAGLERVPGDEAVNQMEELGKEGAIHTIWTMITPFIGAICNCTAQECLGLRTQSMHVETMARGEYTAVVDPGLCLGCGLCAAACPFAAISSQTSDGVRLAAVNPSLCQGCGLCRNHCRAGALSLR